MSQHKSVILPASLRRSQKLSAWVKIFFAEISTYRNDLNIIKVKIQQICEDLHLPTNLGFEAIKFLRSQNYLDLIKFNQDSGEYILRINFELEHESVAKFTDEIKIITSLLNSVCSTSYRPTSKAMKKFAGARLRERFTIDDFELVIKQN